MITKELINTELGAILASLGKPVCNAAMWQEELGDNAPTEEAVLAKKAELDAAKAAVTQVQSAVEAFLAAGFDTGLGFTLGVHPVNDQVKISNMMTWLKNKGPLNTSLWELKDINGVKHEVTYEQFKSIADAYGDYCYAAWKSV